MSENEVISQHYEKLMQLQRLTFRYWKLMLHDMYMTHLAELQKRSFLVKQLNKLAFEDLKRLVIVQLKLADAQDACAQDPEFLKEVFIMRYEKRKLQRELINSMPLYPTESIFWDEHQVPFF